MGQLPEVFRNKSSFINNNDIYNYVKENENIIKKKIVEPNVRQKINNIFNAREFMYKAKVKIILKDEVISTTIIGRNKDKLITLDNKLIEINEILDIEKS